VKELQLEKDPSRHPVLQINFTLQNVTDRTRESSAADGQPELTEYRPDGGGWTATKFDLSATLSETPGGLAGNLTFAASLFDDTSARGFVSLFQHVLSEFARLSPLAGRTRLAEVSRVDETGRAALLAAGAGDEDASARPAGPAR
ncbi:hypothetical protein HHX38_30775, partial [Streptomyces sp. PKU-MA01144]|uniref:condensation domain-containing protein n=1 Tax=Streptomyces sp. PKU-MA01144 TaxID=2729138 RepID=UPI00147FDCDF